MGATASLERLPPTDWVGSGLLKRTRRDFGPLYAGALRVEEFEYPVKLWRTRDGRGYDCLSFCREGTNLGCLWAARDKRNEESADYIGHAKLGGRPWRLRAWTDRDGDLSVMVKAGAPRARVSSTATAWCPRKQGS